MDFLTFDPKKLIISLDGMDKDLTLSCYSHFKDVVAGFKVNHVSINYFENPKELFVDYKLCDIPNTVANVVKHLISLEVEYVTVYMNNSQPVFEALKPFADKIKLLGVTYLTSWTHNESYWIHNAGIGTMYDRTIDLMERFGFYGAIVSPRDLYAFEKSKLKRFCPGVRMSDDSSGDQQRIGTPEEALSNGADYLIMGRSIINRYKNEIQNR